MIDGNSETHPRDGLYKKQQVRCGWQWDVVGKRIECKTAIVEE